MKRVSNENILAALDALGRGAGSEAVAWSLSYDAAGRLKDARRFSEGVSTNAFSERAVTYDRNGNILSLTRYGADTAVPEEALAYSYNGNMLVGVSNSGSSGGGGAYTHDANGNLTRDGLSGLDIRYDDLNLTSRVSSGDTTLAEYGHLADGTKIRSADGSGNGLQYRGSLIYTQTAGQSGSPTLTLDCALTTAGRIVRETAADGSVSYRSLIHLRDHLGSVRAVVDGDTGTVIEANDYYPFGKRIPTPVAEPVEATQHNVGLPVAEPAEVTSYSESHSVASTGSATTTEPATAKTAGTSPARSPSPSSPPPSRSSTSGRGCTTRSPPDGPRKTPSRRSTTPSARMHTVLEIQTQMPEMWQALLPPIRPVT